MLVRACYLTALNGQEKLNKKLQTQYKVLEAKFISMAP